jgi:hypothetical protein
MNSELIGRGQLVATDQIYEKDGKPSSLWLCLQSERPKF